MKLKVLPKKTIFKNNLKIYKENKRDKNLIVTFHIYNKFLYK